MQNYTTQMDAARKGIVTKEMEIVAQKEYRTTEEIRQLVAEGKVAIPANKHHTCCVMSSSVNLGAEGRSLWYLTESRAFSRSRRKSRHWCRTLWSASDMGR